MSRIRVSATKLEVRDGQGIGEGNFEIILKVSEGNNSMESSSIEKLDNGGTPQFIENGEIGYYTVTSGTLSKRFTIKLTELDSGWNENDYGYGSITFSLTPNMKATTKYIDISLKGTNNKNEKGVVRVTLEAQVVS
jgi:hypothetical protein